MSHQGRCKWKDGLLRVLRSLSQRSFFFFFLFFWWKLMNIKKSSWPVWGRRPPRRWHGYEVPPEVRGKLQSSPCPAGHRAPPSLSYPQIAPLSCRRSDPLCKVKRKPILLLVVCKDPVSSHGDVTIFLPNAWFFSTMVNIKSRCSPGATQGLMGRGCDQVSVLKRGGNSPCCNQATDVGHVGQQVGVEFNTKLKRTNIPSSYPQRSVKCFLLM